MRHSQRTCVLTSLAVVCIAGLAWTLDTYNAGFPFQYHADEGVKVAQLGSGTQNFLHPILMLQSVRATLAFAPIGGEETDQALAERGRRVSAAYATAMVVLAFCLFMRLGSPSMALAGALIVAVVPIRVVHAHYLKEDTFLAATLAASLLAFLWFLDRRDRHSLVLWGVATGLACASKYFGASIILVFALAPLITDVGNRRSYFRNGFQALAVASVVFALVNLPALYDPIELLGGIAREVKHGLVGHTLRLFPWAYWMTFHFSQTLVPGLGVGIAVAGLIGMGVALRGRPSPLSRGERILLLYAAVVYLLLELSPTKSHPGFIRYGLPLAIAFAWFAVRAVFTAASQLRRGRVVATALALALLVAEPAWDSLRLIDHLERDTRWLAHDRIEALEPNVAREDYTDRPRDFKYAPEQDLEQLREAGTQHVVLSSFSYQRFEVGNALRWQKKRVYELAAGYRALFTCTYEEIEPEFRAFAFSNPTLRIVDLSSCPEGALRSASHESDRPGAN